MPANYVLLNTTQLTSTASSVTFSSIPQSGYTDLKIVISARTSTNPYSEQFMYYGIGFNEQGNYVNVSGRMFYGNGTATASLMAPTDFTAIGYMPSSGATTSAFGVSEIVINNYTSSTNKPFSVDSASESVATASISSLFAGVWAQTAAITSITITPRTGSWATSSTFSLYGLAATGTIPTTAPKASGGNSVTNDGTYWYHTFLSSGAFIPNQSINCDYLVVAGGGGGGYDTAGGGGAGGLRSTVGATGGGGSLESSLSVSAQRYLVTIGAGGTGMNTGVNRGANGTNSTFGSITSTGGGGGGSDTSASGASGGSGGGTVQGARGGTKGSGTVNQGYDGGQSSGATQGAGGGGAGSAGSAGASTTGGAGGNGITTSISGSSVAYAGGGGGGATGSPTASGGSGGGGNGGFGVSNATSASANTGGGGGGGGASSGNKVGGNGGSGIVIIRYAM